MDGVFLGLGLTQNALKTNMFNFYMKKSLNKFFLVNYISMIEAFSGLFIMIIWKMIFF